MAGMMFRTGAQASLIALAVAAGTPLTATAGDRAVLVGAGIYPHLEDADLPGPPQDVSRMRAMLIEDMGFAPDEITTLVNEEATRDNVLAAIRRELIGETQAGDRVVFYFSGHGDRHNFGGRGEEDGLDEFLLLTDLGRKDALGVLVDDEINALFSPISDRNVMIVVDACHSGTISRSASAALERGRTPVLPPSIFEGLTGLDAVVRSSEGAENTLVPGQNHMSVWSAVAQDEVAIGVSTPSGEARGIFTTIFMAGLDDLAADFNRNGTVSNAELLRFVRRESARYCANSEFCQQHGGRLTPEFSGPIGQTAALGSARIVQPEPTPEPAPAPVVEPPKADPGPTAEPAQPEPEPTPTADPTPTPGPGLTPWTPPAPTGTALPFEETDPPAELNGPGVLTDLFVPQNAAGLRVSIRPGTNLRLEDEVMFEVDAGRGGQLILLDYNPEGELFQIFPSRLSTRGAGRLRPGTNVVIPEALSASGRPIRIRVTEPVGRGHLIAILIEDELRSITDLLPRDVNLDPIPDASGHLYRLAEELNRMQSTAAGPRESRWSSVVLPYTITQ